jgi:GT2 family glycosyltransferase
MIYVSVVSHNHKDLIESLGVLSEISMHSDVTIIIKSNTKERFQLGSARIIHLESHLNCGFGENNNIVFSYCRDVLGMRNDDFFVVLKPDVKISYQQLKSTCVLMEKHKMDFECINLFKDDSYELQYESVRKFPTFVYFVLSFLNIKSMAYRDRKKKNLQEVDWAAGSFLAFTEQHYNNLNGFDERYFMYCEDIYICFRSKKIGVPLYYLDSIKAVHYGQHVNRKVFSKHFVWHLKSIVRFLISK